MINVKPGMVETGFYSHEVIVFENLAVSLARNEFAIETIADLKDRDVVAFQMDRNIFRYYRKQAQIQDLPGVEVRRKVRYHRLFPRTHYRCAFKRRDICRDFDYGLKTIRENGTYQQILEKYEKMTELIGLRRIPR